MYLEIEIVVRPAGEQPGGPFQLYFMGGRGFEPLTLVTSRQCSTN